MKLPRWRSLIRRSQVESEMSAELQFHIESYAEDLMKKGLSREDAVRRARMEFGAIEAKKEECRQSLGLRLFDELRGDVRYALRLMKQSPGFAAIAIVSLALGIGANTAIFTLANQLLMTSMKVPQADRLRVITWEVRPNEHFPAPAWGSFGPGLASPISYRMYLDMRRNNRVFDDLVAFKDVYRLTATIDDQADPVDGWVVSGNFYQVLGAKIIAGRAIAPEDDSPSAAPVVVISDAYWVAPVWPLRERSGRENRA